MLKYFQSFNAKLTIVLLVLLSIVGIAQIVITTRSFHELNYEVDQRLNITLARDMAFELNSLLVDEKAIDYGKIGERIHYMMVMNPKIEIYLLNESGKILAFFAEPGKEVVSDVVELDPVNEFIQHTDRVPILGSDPRQPGKYKPFSAAELKIGENPGFLYIIIGGEDYDSAYAFLRESYIAKAMIRSLTFTLVLTAITGFILFWILTSRLRKIAEGVQEFDQGNLEKRISIHSKDEFGQLSETFNNMADKIEETILKLKETDSLRRDLTANVSHDLRTPIASIRGYIETILMKSGSMTEEERKNHLEIVLKNIVSLGNLVQELFQLSKLEAKQIDPQLEEMSIVDLVQDIYMKYRQMAENHGIQLDVTVGKDIPVVFADIGLIERAITNLLDNAIHYTPENGHVGIILEGSKNGAHLEISDTGQGIKPEELPYIFDRYYKTKDRPSRSKTSTGLGLTIAQKIVELHGSKINVSSVLNEGSAFSFKLHTSELFNVINK